MGFMETSAAIVIASGFVWLVKVVVNDIKHDLAEMKQESKSQTKILKRIERKL